MFTEGYIQSVILGCWCMDLREQAETETRYHIVDLQIYAKHYGGIILAHCKNQQQMSVDLLNYTNYIILFIP